MIAPRKSKTPTKRSINSDAKKKAIDRVSSPAFSSICTPSQNLTQPDNNLKIALQLAEYHQQESHRSKQLILELEKQLADKNKQLEELSQQIKTLNFEHDTISLKYQRIKEKCHKTKNSSKQAQQQALAHEQRHSKENLLQNVCGENEELRRVIGEQIESKNITIRKLYQQVSECEQNTMDIFRLVNVLEQRVQELTMDNNLLRGMMRNKAPFESRASLQTQKE